MSLPNKSLFLTRGQASNLFQQKNQLVQYFLQITEPGGTFNANFTKEKKIDETQRNDGTQFLTLTAICTNLKKTY